VTGAFLRDIATIWRAQVLMSASGFYAHHEPNAH